ncbi:MAG: GNAT family N-acetyltransferase [Clostridiales Family XIII bacterium]|jgi:N-acetylglutamate synthase-like GNAT family acetyltransferase|nr:GNAT family N-acetyltransferase [Clostridiales Family XIII bacterium]
MNGDTADIVAVDRHDALVDMFIRNGLEFSADDEMPDDIIVERWEARRGGRLVGGCMLALREGEYIVDGIAVEPELRGDGLGRRLLATAIEEMRARGGRTLFLVARAPGFFRSQGFVTIAREDAPGFFECFGCPQYGASCHPEVMRLDLDKTAADAG